MSCTDGSLRVGTAGSCAMTGALQCRVNYFLNADESSFGRAGLEIPQQHKPAAACETFRCVKV